MRVLRILVSGLVMAAMLTVGVDGSDLSLGGSSAYAKRHRKRHRKHRKRGRRHHGRHHGLSTPAE